MERTRQPQPQTFVASHTSDRVRDSSSAQSTAYISTPPCCCIDSVLENTLLAHVVYVHAQAAVRWPNENGSICLSSASVRPNHERALKSRLL